MQCYLILDDGSCFSGVQFGAGPPGVKDLAGLTEFSKGPGEVVFNTGMTGYHEILTDPSYTGQIVVMTYPHMGNYGTDDTWSENGPEDRLLPRVKSQGFVVREYYDGPVPPGRLSLAEFLKKYDTPGISGVDTRALTLHLRDTGSRNGIIVKPAEGGVLQDEELRTVLDYLQSFPSMEGRNCISEVGMVRGENNISDGDLRIVAVDCGTKGNILREMKKFGVGITVLPSGASAEQILALSPHGVLFSNGPGDPATLDNIIDEIKKLAGKVPLFGICLGHQLIASALGARTRKMKFGHHGCNNPVRDELTGRVAVTSQNHGFDVDEKSLPSDTRVWFRNANDRTIEGIIDDGKRVYTSQFHPEAAPGPHDSLWIFRRFYEEMQRFEKETGGQN
ncbi:glutamine-hydrolyzing carbamoyl-phosphate synthase small subunit [Marispirochaeta sp.]|uniref:glutamine-hydrolyzing carbamoyl-phosphate synthase small subunit n=1 Tax=Marispirochaeta sp. TaxID=2038653 RepID=UPI0029C89E29|nr:glutamine-hydrolyzing carbamoyl-phosphate synthase small subunit [Marispirochaeta sp.]